MREHPPPVGSSSTARRTARVLSLTVLVLALTLLALPGAPGAGADSGTYVRLAQLSPDMAGATISISSVAGPARDVVLPGEPYGALSAYQRIEPGDYVVAIRGAGNATTPVVSSALKAESGASYTLASIGAADKRELAVFTDDLTAPPTGRARVRVINAAPPAPVLDVRGPGGAPFSTGLPLAQVSGYRTVDAGTLPLSAGPPGGMGTDLAVPVGANQVISVVLVSDGPRITAQPHVDAAGPTAVPPGAIAAGYGGGADPHGPLSELLLGGVAVAAGLAAAFLSREGQVRGPRVLIDALYGLIGDDAAAVVALGATLAAGVLLWVLAARLSVSPASGAAVLAIYAAAVLVVDVASGPGVDGAGLLLLVAAATLAVGGGAVRNGLAVALLVLAVGVIPVAAVGLILLLGAMAVPGALLHRLPRRARITVGFGAIVPAAAVALYLARFDEPPALPPLVPAVLTLWGALVAGVLWRRVTWLRPACAALAGLVACLWIPGPDGDAVLVVVATTALLTAVAAEDISAVLARRVLVAVAASAVAGATVLMTPAVTGNGPALLRPPAAAPGDGAVAAPVRPVAVSIPALSVAGPLEDLVADPASGELAAPADPARAGWYAAGVVPGDQGPAVIGGHVDSRSGPGIFFRLRTLRPGDLVDVTRSDGRTVRFSVIAVALYPKDRFPTEAVYGPTSGPELRLVTCGGTFDRSARSYADNVVVDAALV